MQDALFDKSAHRNFFRSFARWRLIRSVELGTLSPIFNDRVL